MKVSIVHCNQRKTPTTAAQYTLLIVMDDEDHFNLELFKLHMVIGTLLLEFQ